MRTEHWPQLIGAGHDWIRYAGRTTLVDLHSTCQPDKASFWRRTSKASGISVRIPLISSPVSTRSGRRASTSSDKYTSNLETPVSSGTLVDPEQVALMKDIPEFTPEQWAWIKAESARYERGYKPTSSLIEGL